MKYLHFSNVLIHHRGFGFRYKQGTPWCWLDMSTIFLPSWARCTVLLQLFFNIQLPVVAIFVQDCWFAFILSFYCFLSFIFPLPIFHESPHRFKVLFRSILFLTTKWDGSPDTFQSTNVQIISFFLFLQSQSHYKPVIMPNRIFHFPGMVLAPPDCLSQTPFCRPVLYSVQFKFYRVAVCFAWFSRFCELFPIWGSSILARAPLAALFKFQWW